MNIPLDAENANTQTTLNAIAANTARLTLNEIFTSLKTTLTTEVYFFFEKKTHAYLK